MRILNHSLCVTQEKGVPSSKASRFKLPSVFPVISKLFYSGATSILGDRYPAQSKVTARQTISSNSFKKQIIPQEKQNCNCKMTNNHVLQGYLSFKYSFLSPHKHTILHKLFQCYEKYG